MYTPKAQIGRGKKEKKTSSHLDWFNHIVRDKCPASCGADECLVINAHIAHFGGGCWETGCRRRVLVEGLMTQHAASCKPPPGGCPMLLCRTLGINPPSTGPCIERAFHRRRACRLVGEHLHCDMRHLQGSNPDMLWAVQHTDSCPCPSDCFYCRACTLGRGRGKLRAWLHSTVHHMENGDPAQECLDAGFDPEWCRKAGAMDLHSRGCTPSCRECVGAPGEVNMHNALLHIFSLEQPRPCTPRTCMLCTVYSGTGECEL